MHILQKLINVHWLQSLEVEWAWHFLIWKMVLFYAPPFTYDKVKPFLDLSNLQIKAKREQMYNVHDTFEFCIRAKYGKKWI